MIEWQKGSLFVTVALPISENKSKVHVFKYLDKYAADEWETNELVWETAWKQDRLQAELMTEFSQANLEPQKKHFRNFLQSNDRIY
jgi:hypothetical protein